ncbi:hypothetical protein AMELA_G00075920 [Ameiurus melas]|uniref:Immunoglobulin V-set domain-containing protein n=1 Tax=Ameiurus melas TaxID=219545 RepID=A0A7J6AYB0_AMEME|nr:hypothetical protein AMELA_G00075920 [Ameiurus melas]
MMMMMMTELFLLVIFFTVKQSVSQAVIPVDTIFVQQGKSIIIPCVYNAKYINNQKYLCYENKLKICKDVQQRKDRTVLISDDKTQHIFTVTMKDVTTSDTGNYWCHDGSNVTKEFLLQVINDTPQLYVNDQMVTGYEGNNTVISFRHQNKKPKEWCKIGGACVSTSGNMNGALVQFSSMDMGFSVTMSKLTMDNTGWYSYSVGDEQMPVHITVLSRKATRERRSFAWLVFLGLLITIICMAVIVFRKHKHKCQMFSLLKRSENSYVSMKKPKLPTKQHEDENVEAQDYEIMSNPMQSLGVQENNPEGKESPKTGRGHITHKVNVVPEGSYCTSECDLLYINMKPKEILVHKQN